MARSNPIRRALRLFFSRIIFLSRQLYFILLIAVLATLLLVTRNQPDWLSSLRVDVNDATVAVADVINQPVIWLQQVYDRVFILGDLVEENRELRKRVEALTLQLNKAESDNRAFLALKEKHHVVDAAGDERFTARIVADVGGVFSRAALLQMEHAAQHIAPGFAVANHDGLIGQVIEVGQHSARVMTITSHVSHVPVLTQATRERAMLRGNDGALPSLHYLPPDSATYDGEAVVTSGDGGVFPAGILVGYVHFEGDDAMLIPAVKWQRLDWVSVMGQADE